MNEEIYKQKHHAEWAKFISTEAGQDLFRLIEAKHPSRSLPSGNDNLGLLTNGAVALLNDIAGYEKLANVFRNLHVPPAKPDPEPPDSYEDSEIPIPPKS